MKFYGKELIIIKLEDRFINIVHSKNKKIDSAHKISIPENMFKDKEIIDVDFIADKINGYIFEKKLSCAGVVFVISGSDIVIRHSETPIMEESKILDAAKWEMTQYLPEQGEEHYIDYEILNKQNNEEKKVYNVLVCAAPKKKSEVYKEIADKINLKLIAIEIEANSLSKLFEPVYLKDKQFQDIGIIKIDSNSTSFIILQNGKLFFQREVPFGKENIVKQISNSYRIAEAEALDILKKFDLNLPNEEDEKNQRIKRSIDNIIASFEKFIQFYFTGKTKKNLDKVFIIEEELKIKGLEQYTSDALNTEVELFNFELFKSLGIIYNNDIHIDNYIFSLGTILKDDKKKYINLIPYSMKEVSKSKLNKSIIYMASGLLGLLIVVFLGMLIYSFKLNGDNSEAKLKVANYGVVKNKNDKLAKEVNMDRENIEEYNKLKNNDDVTTEWIKGLQNYMPADVSLTTLSRVGSTYSIIGKATQPNSPGVLLANLQQSENYSKATLQSVTFSDGAYKFTIQIGGGNNGQTK